LRGGTSAISFAVGHQHHLGPFAPLGRADFIAPPFAEAKFPSTKLSVTFSHPRRCNRSNKVRPMSSHTPVFIQSQSAPAGGRAGKSVGQIPLPRPGLQHPQNPLQGGTVVRPETPSLWTAFQFRQQRRDLPPLPVCQHRFVSSHEAPLMHDNLKRANTPVNIEMGL